jgi:alkylated DNA repair dioxygenase AlkB
MNDEVTLACLRQRGARVDYLPRFFEAEAADELMRTLLSSIEFDPTERSMIRRPFSRDMVRIPRLQSAYGDPGTSYRFSGTTVEPRPWTTPLLALRRQLRSDDWLDPNFVLVSYYRDGADYMGWHSDDEKDLGEEPVIASLSLGAHRPFQFRHKQPPHETLQLVPGHGSLLVMRHPTNRDWKHALPKRGGNRPATIGPRLNLTFRRTRSRATLP